MGGSRSSSAGEEQKLLSALWLYSHPGSKPETCLIFHLASYDDVAACVLLQLYFIYKYIISVFNDG